MLYYSFGAQLILDVVFFGDDLVFGGVVIVFLYDGVVCVVLDYLEDYLEDEHNLW